MRIGLIVTRFPYGGAEKQALAFTDFLLQKGHRAEILAIENKDSFKKGNIKVVGLGLNPLGLSIRNFFKFIIFLISLRRAIKDNYDVLITYPQNYFLGLIAGRQVLKIISIRMFYPNSIHYFRKKLLKKFDLVITNNLPQYSLLHAVNIKSILMNNTVLNINSNNQKFNDNKKYLIIANIKRRKNLEVALCAFGVLVEQGFKLSIVGRIEDEKYYHELKNQVLNKDKIKFLGYKSPDELRILYQSVEGVVHSSKREGAANVIFEAMAYGTPIIVYRIPENVSLIENKKEFLFEDACELIKKIECIHDAVRNKEKWIYDYICMQKEKIRQLYLGNDYELILKKIEKIRNNKYCDK